MKEQIRAYSKSFWNSPTLMTWMSYSTKALTLFGILPLILKKFSAEDIVLWYLFATIISLQTISDFGFRQTFIRIISYAFGGAEHIDAHPGNGGSGESKEPNLPLLNQVVSMMIFIYKWLTLLLLIATIVFGTWSLKKAILNSPDHSGAWISWIIVIVVSCLGFYGKIYLNFLEGLFKIALVRRVETLTSIGSIICSLAVLTFAPSLLNLIIVNQGWVLVATFRDYYLARRTENNLYSQVFKKLPFDKPLFSKIWKPAWRSGVSGLMSTGLTNFSGLIYAQVGQTVEIASYLLALRIMNQIKDIAMAPFYSKIPYMSMLRVNGNLEALKKVVSKGMFLSHLTFVTGFIVFGVFSDSLLKLIGSQVPFVDSFFWFLLGLAFFTHRFGAMHIQSYMSTNHVISHIADGVSGVIFICVVLFSLDKLGIYAISIGMLVAYLGFYCWYAAKFSYRSLNTNFFELEKKASFFPTLLLIVYFIVTSVI